MKLKKSYKQFHAVFHKDVADITSVFFKDDVIDLNPNDGDRLIWLFRDKWNFGLFFDLTGDLKAKTVLEELGYYYKRLCYLNEYKFIENTISFNQAISDGWFPFVALIGNGFDKIQLYYKEEKKHQAAIDDVVKRYSDDVIKELVERWWSNPIFAKKKNIIQAGINSYLQHNEDGYVNAIKNLSSELEGIIRISFHADYGRAPTTKDLKKYISDKGKESFSSMDSLGFPEKFLDYLNEYIFKKFDVNAGDIPESRHSVAHGVADKKTYNRDFAFKLILTLDQIYFFLGNK